MSQVTCYMFVPGAFVGLENLVPFQVRLKEEGWKIYTVVVDEFMDRCLETTPAYDKIIRDNSEVISIGFKKTDNKIRKIGALLRFFVLMARILMTRDPRVITFQPVKGIFYRLLKKLSRVKGRFYEVSKANTPLPTERFLVEERAMKDPEKRKFLAKQHESLRAEHLDTHLMHSEREGPVSDIFQMPAKRIIVGYPKLMSAWRQFLKTFRTPWDVPELETAKSFITVILLEPHIYFFSKEAPVPLLLKEVIQAVRKNFPDELLVFKPKPRPQRIKPYDYTWLGQVLDEMGEKNYAITNTPNPFLAQKSKAAVIIGETTGLFEYLIAGVPSIEHCRYNKAWLEIYPPGTFWVEFGVRLTETFEDLDRTMREIKDGTFKPIVREDLVKMFGHTEDPGVFRSL